MNGPFSGWLPFLASKTLIREAKINAKRIRIVTTLKIVSTVVI